MNKKKSKEEKAWVDGFLLELHASPFSTLQAVDDCEITLIMTDNMPEDTVVGAAAKTE